MGVWESPSLHTHTSCSTYDPGSACSPSFWTAPVLLYDIFTFICFGLAIQCSRCANLADACSKMIFVPLLTVRMLGYVMLCPNIVVICR